MDVLDANARKIEHAKLRAIGMRNKVLNERENRDQTKKALERQIAEKTADLERYRQQAQSLRQVEAEQKALIEKLGNAEV